jgi:ankyrin repeat protein
LQKRDNWRGRIWQLGTIEIMKTTLGVLIFLLSATLAQAQTNNLTALLQRGLFEEQANRNLDAAISDYQALAKQFDKDRQLAATAVFRLGECYRMQGKTNEAALEYQRILRDFSDQTPLTTLSRQNLAGMGVQLAPGVSEARQQQKDLLAKQIALAEQDLAETQKLVQVGKAVAADTRAAEREVLRLRQQLVALDAGRTELIDLSPPANSEEDQEIARIQTMIQNSPDLINGEPLWRAANMGRLRVATFLLDHGADVNAMSGGETPLISAAMNAQKAMVELLLSRGADVNARASNGGTALLAAAEGGFQAVAEVLLAHKADVNEPFTKMHNEETPLHEAAQRGYANFVSLLLTNGADANVINDDGRTPLFLAVRGGQEKIVQLLLDAGARPNVEDRFGRTPLSYAADSGSPEMVKMLLAAKADPNAGKLDPPLLCAIHKQDTASAELLLQAGANPNAIGKIEQFGNYDGYFMNHKDHLTPLWLAIYLKQVPMVQLLLKFKADPNDSQTDGQPLLFSAMSDTNMLESLLDAGATVDPVNPDETDRTPLGAAANQNNAPAVAILLKHGANPNVRNRNGVTPLHFAAYGRADRKVFELLLAAHANVNLRDSNGDTPLHLAVRNGKQDVVQLLLDAKADPNIRNHSGFTALDIAKNGSQNAAVPPELLSFVSPGAPLSYQWNNSAQPESPVTNSLANLLRQHGALDVLPDWDRITVSRPSAKYSSVIFYKGTNDWNQFTLLELLSKLDYRPRPPFPNFPFPDFAHIVIVRPNATGTTPKRIEVNLLDSTNGVDCSKDLTLNFGDTVEIPEREHTLAESDFRLNRQMNEIVSFLQNHAGEAKLVVAGGQTIQLPLKNFEPVDCTVGTVLRSSMAQNVLTSASDLSRVKVTRRNPPAGKTEQWILDCSQNQQLPPPVALGTSQSFSARLQMIMQNASQPVSSLWLRDGDVIDVPEKQ